MQNQNNIEKIAVKKQKYAAKKFVEQNFKKDIRAIIIITLSSLLGSFAIHNFIQAANLASGGLTGIAIIINHIIPVPGGIGLLYFILNIPLIILAFRSIGKRFAFYTTISIVATSIFLIIMPDVHITDNMLMSAVYGGLLNGMAVAFTLDAGGSMGGTDIIAMYVSTKKQKSPGNFMLIVNGGIIIVSGLIFGLETALYTLIAQYVASTIIDKIHVRYQRVTLSIITDKKEALVDHLLEIGNHGITVIEVEGAYTQENKHLLYMIISTYELKLYQQEIRKVDKNAFINITKSIQVSGNFYQMPIA